VTAEQAQGFLPDASAVPSARVARQLVAGIPGREQAALEHIDDLVTLSVPGELERVSGSVLADTTLQTSNAKSEKRAALPDFS
jgi:hypothetical protein